MLYINSYLISRIRTERSSRAWRAFRYSSYPMNLLCICAKHILKDLAHMNCKDKDRFKETKRHHLNQKMSICSDSKEYSINKGIYYVFAPQTTKKERRSIFNCLFDDLFMKKCMSRQTWYLYRPIFRKGEWKEQVQKASKTPSVCKDVCTMIHNM